MFNSKRAIELVMVLVFIIVSLNTSNASAGNPFKENEDLLRLGQKQPEKAKNSFKDVIQEKLNTIIQILEEKLQPVPCEPVPCEPVPCGYTCGGTLSEKGRWCDNGDGTIKDMTTGLIWVQKGDCMVGPWDRVIMLTSANLRSGSCGLTDGSLWGDWRMPTAKELVGITQGVEPVQSATPRLFVNIIPFPYWSSTTTHDIDTSAYGVGMATLGDLQGYGKDEWAFFTLPVRSAN